MPAVSFNLSMNWPTVESLGDPMFCIELSEKTKSNNEIKGMHFHAYRKLRTRISTLIAAQLPAERLAAIERSFIVIERHSAGALDWDNAYGGLKPVLDSLVQCSDKNPDGLGVIKDDGPKNMPYPPFVVQHHAKQKKDKTVIRIYALH